MKPLPPSEVFLVLDVPPFPIDTVQPIDVSEFVNRHLLAVCAAGTVDYLVFHRFFCDNLERKILS